MEVSAAIKKIIGKKKLKNLQTDKGKEFYNSHMTKLMHDLGINHYSTHSDLKASIVERLNRTIKNKMYQRFTALGHYKWVNLLPSLMKKYNNTPHRSIGTTPTKAKHNVKAVRAFMQSHLKVRLKKPRFAVGDKVRISKVKGAFRKGYLASWSNEIHEIESVRRKSTDPVTYTLKGIDGTFYEQELLKTSIPDVYLIEKVLKKKGDRLYVKWKGFSPEHNSWISKSSVQL